MQNIPENNNAAGTENTGYQSYTEKVNAAAQQPADTGAEQQYTRVAGDGQYRFVPQSNIYTQPQQNVPQAAPVVVNTPYAVPVYSQPVDRKPSRGEEFMSDVFTGKKKHLVAGIALGVAASLLFGLCGAMLYRSINMRKYQHGAANIVLAETPVNEVIVPEDDATLMNCSQIAAKVRSGVVGVTCYTNAYGWGTFTYSQGSGFIITDTGYVVTNSHVINDERNTQLDITVTVTEKNGENKEVPVEVVGFDVKTDLAVLKFDPEGIDFTVCELGDSTKLVLGEDVVAIGNPGGAQFAGSVTNGIVSGLDRVIDENGGASENSMKYIQTNAAINPGNSGGPLLNMYGQVIGITSSKIVASGYEGLGFAIPVLYARPIIEELIEHGYVMRPAMGVKLGEISAQSAAWYDVPQGLLIRAIASNSSFLPTNVEVGDIITAVNGEETKTLNEFQNIMDGCAVGDTVKVTIFRRGASESFEVEIKLIADKEATYEEVGTSFLN